MQVDYNIARGFLLLLAGDGTSSDFFQARTCAKVGALCLLVCGCKKVRLKERDDTVDYC
jgi:hypothetical protein